MPPTYIFLIDVSYRAVSAGILPTIAESIKSCLDKLPGGERTHVGFITFDSSLHFYKLSPGASAPQMMVHPLKFRLSSFAVTEVTCFSCVVVCITAPVLSRVHESYSTKLSVGC